MAKNLTIQTEPNTRLVEIFYNSTDPQLAADFANALTAEFIQQNLEARWKTTQQTGEWLTRQMDDVRIKLEKSEDELQSYAHASGLLFTSENRTSLSMSPRISCGSFRRNSPGPTRTASPSSRCTSRPRAPPPSPSPRCSMTRLWASTR